MAVKNTKLGGVDFATPTARIKPTDLNDTFTKTATGVYRLMNAGEGLTAGDVGYFNLATGKVFQAGTGTHNTNRANCIILETVSTDDPVLVQTSGEYITSGLTANDIYYLGASGAISTTQSGVRIGTAISTTVLMIDIFQDDRDAVGMVKAYHKSMTGIPANNITAFWVECNGATISDAESPLNGQAVPLMDGSSGSKRFIRGSTTSGTTGGSETHTHTIATISPSRNNAQSGGTLDLAQSGDPTNATSTLPSYMEFVMLFKIK